MSDEKTLSPGARNLAKWRAENPNIRHGARSAHFRKRFTDARTTEGRRLKATMDALRADLGAVSPAQAIILDRVRQKLITCMCVEAYLEKQPTVVTDTGELLPGLQYGYSTFAEALRRDIELLYTLASKRPAKTTPLADYIKSKGAGA